LAEQTTWLIHIQQAPRQGLAAALGVDATLACGAFGQSVALLLDKDGLELLTPGSAQPEGDRNLHKLLQSLPLYEVERIYAVTPSENVLPMGELQVEAITAEQSRSLIANSRHVISF
jgi:sulfur relay (sulfurtransferase) DsrF/TusC family protein